MKNLSKIFILLLTFNSVMAFANEQNPKKKTL